jgi:hypothetical protein
MTSTSWSSLDQQIARKREQVRRALLSWPPRYDAAGLPAEKLPSPSSGPSLVAPRRPSSSR